MDRINTWGRRLVLSVALLWPFPAGASSLELDILANEASRHANLANVIIVGERHNNVHLADEVLELLARLRVNHKFDCLFVEFPTDLQGAFDHAVKEADFDGFIRAVHLSWKPRYQTAFDKLGYKSKTDQADIASWLDKLDEGVKVVPTHPVNRELLFYLRENKISLLPYDAHSRSTVMADTARFVLYWRWRYYHATPELDSKMQAAMIKNVDDRNLIMAENIVTKFTSRQCTKAVVVVGEGHVANKAQLEGFYGVRPGIFTPLQIRLREKGLPSPVVGNLLGQ